MILSIGNWTMEKAKGANADSSVVPIRLIANRLITDKDNEEILPEAFNKATVENFLKNGIIDWHHQSVLGKSSEDKAGAIIGSPTDFKWEGGLPVVYANLTKGHPIVANAILPHLEAGNPVFGSSVGGNVRKAKRVWDAKSDAIKRQISSISWDHLAIAGKPYVICPGTEVRMVKAETGHELFVHFSDLGTFQTEYGITEKEEELVKALTVGCGTDSAAATGVDAMRKQSLEGDDEKKKKKKKKAEDTVLLMARLVDTINRNVIASNKEGLQLFLKAEGYTDAEAANFAETFLPGLQHLLNY